MLSRRPRRRLLGRRGQSNERAQRIAPRTALQGEGGRGAGGTVVAPKCSAAVLGGVLRRDHAGN
ncbi:MAG TPA: hypothetical protein VIK64_01430, partial [Anaerolineales bacterium]